MGLCQGRDNESSSYGTYSSYVYDDNTQDKAKWENKKNKKNKSNMLKIYYSMEKGQEKIPDYIDLDKAEVRKIHRGADGNKRLFIKRKSYSEIKNMSNLRENINR